MIEKFLSDEQDPKAVEKIHTRLTDLMTTGEEILYIAVQKKPIVNLLPDCVALTNKRILFFSPANLGLSIKFVDFVWKDILEVYTREEIIGAIFSVKTTDGLETGVDYLPRVQARKLYQYAQERKEAEREARRLRDLEEKRAESGSIQFENAARFAAQQPVVPVTPPPITDTDSTKQNLKPDELTEKLKKLRMLFDNGLISQEEYNQKKLELLNEL